MSTIEKAHVARANKTLDKVIRYQGKLTTWRKLVDEGAFVGKCLTYEDGAKYNRRQYNRMDQRQQEAWEKRARVPKKEYALVYADTVFVTVPKVVYDYATLPVTKTFDFRSESKHVPI